MLIVSALPLVVVFAHLPMRCSPRLPKEQPLPASGPKVEAPPVRETLVTAPPPVAPITLPDEVIVRAIDAVRPSFAACFKRALDTELIDPPLKITLHLEVDPAGKITSGTTNAPTPKFGNCLLRVAYGLSFGAPNRAAVVDVPLFFR